MDKKPWDRPAPRRTVVAKQMSDSEKRRAAQYARKAGRPYPNLIDNMRVIRERNDG